MADEFDDATLKALCQLPALHLKSSLHLKSPGLHLKSGAVRDGLRVGVTAGSLLRVSGALDAMGVSANVQVIARLALGIARLDAKLMGPVETDVVEVWTAPNSVTAWAMCQHVRKARFGVTHDQSVASLKSNR